MQEIRQNLPVLLLAVGKIKASMQFIKSLCHFSMIMQPLLIVIAQLLLYNEKLIR